MFYACRVVNLWSVRPVAMWVAEAGSAVAAGWPSPADDYMEGPLDLSEKLMPRPAATFLVRASGWSMRDAGISDGDMLIVERGRTPRDGQIIIAVVDTEFLVKTLRMGRRPRLVAANPDFPDIPLAGRDIQVWGVVCWVLHRTI